MARSHNSTTVPAECDTNNTVAPFSRIWSMRAKHLRWNASSPTESASSTTRISGSALIATAKARRTYMPLEYVLTCCSMNSPMSANAAISSKRASISTQSKYRGIEVDILTASEFRIESRSQLQQCRHPTMHAHLASSGCQRAADNLQQGRFSRAIAADNPDGFTAADVEADIAQRPEFAKIAALRSVQPTLRPR